MAMNARTVVCAVGVALLVLGCTDISGVKLCNNSGEAITLVSVVGEIPPHAGKTRTNRIVIANGHEVKVNLISSFSVQSANWHWSYRPEIGIPGRFYRHEHGHWRFVQVQLEQDGTIYVLTPGSTSPVHEFAAQPPGYPLHPLRK